MLEGDRALEIVYAELDTSECVYYTPKNGSFLPLIF